ncbi:hypothetical protein ACOME3_001944 [Neoechinorhynchus agilis]
MELCKSPHGESPKCTEEDLYTQSRNLSQYYKSVLDLLNEMVNQSRYLWANRRATGPEMRHTTTDYYEPHQQLSNQMQPNATQSDQSIGQFNQFEQQGPMFECQRNEHGMQNYHTTNQQHSIDQSNQYESSFFYNQTQQIGQCTQFEPTFPPNQPQRSDQVWQSPRILNPTLQSQRLYQARQPNRYNPISQQHPIHQLNQYEVDYAPNQSRPLNQSNMSMYSDQPIDFTGQRQQLHPVGVFDTQRNVEQQTQFFNPEISQPLKVESNFSEYGRNHLQESAIRFTNSNAAFNQSQDPVYMEPTLQPNNILNEEEILGMSRAQAEQELGSMIPTIKIFLREVRKQHAHCKDRRMFYKSIVIVKEFQRGRPLRAITLKKAIDFVEKTLMPIMASEWIPLQSTSSNPTQLQSAYSSLFGNVERGETVVEILNGNEEGAEQRIAENPERTNELNATNRKRHREALENDKEKNKKIRL